MPPGSALLESCSGWNSIELELQPDGSYIGYDALDHNNCWCATIRHRYPCNVCTAKFGPAQTRNCGLVLNIFQIIGGVAQEALHYHKYSNAIGAFDDCVGGFYRLSLGSSLYVCPDCYGCGCGGGGGYECLEIVAGI